MRESQKGIIIGRGGSALRRLGTDARRDIERFVGRKVFLDLRVKVDTGMAAGPTEAAQIRLPLTMGNIVAIVGRPNVGKSTLFNRLVESKQAITDPTAGTTRDRHYGMAEWTGAHFSVIDTGGYITSSDDVFEPEIRRQVHLAMDEADAIVFLVDARSGVTAMDEAIADMLRRSEQARVPRGQQGGHQRAAGRRRGALCPGHGRGVRHFRAKRIRHRRTAGRLGGEAPVPGGPRPPRGPKHRYRRSARTWASRRSSTPCSAESSTS